MINNRVGVIFINNFINSLIPTNIKNFYYICGMDLRQFINERPYLNHAALSRIGGISPVQFHYWLKGRRRISPGKIATLTRKLQKSLSTIYD